MKPPLQEPPRGRGDEAEGKKDEEQGDGDPSTLLRSFVLRNSFPSPLFPILSFVFGWRCAYFLHFLPPLFSVLWVCFELHRHCTKPGSVSHTPGNTSVQNIKAKKKIQRKKPKEEHFQAISSVHFPNSCVLQARAEPMNSMLITMHLLHSSAHLISKALTENEKLQFLELPSKI